MFFFWLLRIEKCSTAGECCTLHFLPSRPLTVLQDKYLKLYRNKLHVQVLNHKNNEEEKLILLVLKYPCLYHMTSPDADKTLCLQSALKGSQLGGFRRAQVNKRISIVKCQMQIGNTSVVMSVSLWENVLTVAPLL